MAKSNSEKYMAEKVPALSNDYATFKFSLRWNTDDI